MMNERAHIWFFVSDCVTYQHMPNIFIGPFKAAEPNTDSQKSLATPHVAGCDSRLPHCHRLATVQQHLDGPLHVDLQQLF